MRNIVITGLCMMAALQIQAAEWVVSPDGVDSNAGTVAAPFKTLDAARNAIRAARKTEGAHDATRHTVLLRTGRYFLDQPFVLGPQDSQTTYKAYPGETPVLDGSSVISGWAMLKDEPSAVTGQAKGKLWVANVEKGWKFCFLYVDGHLAQRSRMINNSKWRDWPKNHTAGEPEMQGQLVTFSGNREFLKALPSNGDAEMVCIMAQYGVMGNGVIKAVDASAGTLRWNSKQVNLRGSRNPHERGYNIENALSLIDEPGEWAVDSAAGKLYYWPKAGEDLSKVEVLAPKAYELVRLQGYDDPAQAGNADHALVRGVELDGITMQYTDRLPEDRWPESWLIRQWENVDATLYVQGAEGCAVKNCRILYSGAYGVTLNHHAQRITLQQNEIGWTGSGGLFLEGYGPGKTDVCRDNVVVLNHIHDHGLANYWHSPSVQIYQSGHNRIALNYMERSAYSAVSMVGMHPKYMNDIEMMAPGTWLGQWHCQAHFSPLIQDFPSDVVESIKAGAKPFNRDTMKPYIHSNSNRVERNIIVDPHSLLNEGGAIYAWCPGKGNQWLENAIFVSHAMPGSSILALDDMAEYFTVERNVFWVNGHILNGVGARGNERGNVIADNHRVMFKPEHNARVKKGLGSWWINHSGREKLDELTTSILAEVKEQGGWPGNPKVGIPAVEKGEALGDGPEMVLPEGSNVTIEE